MVGPLRDRPTLRAAAAQCPNAPLCRIEPSNRAPSALSSPRSRRRCRGPRSLTHGPRSLAHGPRPSVQYGPRSSMALGPWSMAPGPLSTALGPVWRSGLASLGPRSLALDRWPALGPWPSVGLPPSALGLWPSVAGPRPSVRLGLPSPSVSWPSVWPGPRLIWRGPRTSFGPVGVWVHDHGIDVLKPGGLRTTLALGPADRASLAALDARCESEPRPSPSANAPAPGHSASSSSNSACASAPAPRSTAKAASARACRTFPNTWWHRARCNSNPARPGCVSGTRSNADV